MYNELKIIKDEFHKLRELYSELKSCCNKNADSVANQDIEMHVERILLNYLPPGMSKEDLTKISQNLFASYNKEGLKIIIYFLNLLFLSLHIIKNYEYFFSSSSR